MKQKVSIKILSFIMAVVCIISACTYPAFAEEDVTESTTAADTVLPTEPTTSEEDEEKAKLEAQKTLEEQRADLEAKLNDANNKLKEYGDNAEVTEEYINALDEKIGYLNEELVLLDKEVIEANTKIAELDEQMAPLEEQIGVLQTQYDKSKAEYEQLEEDFQSTYDAYCLRLRAMYISGSSSIIVALLTSKDISQFLSRFEMIKAVSKSDTELLKQVNSQMDAIISKQDGLNAKRNQLTAAKAELDAKKEEYKKLQDTVNTKVSEIASKKVTLADERAKSDELFAKYAAKNQIYSDFADEDEDAIAALDEEIDALLTGRKTASEVTTAKNPELKDESDVDISSSTGDIFSNSNAALSLTWPVPGYTSLSQHFGHVRAGRVHKGIDIPCPTGTNVVAAQKGIVIRSRRTLTEAYGYHIMIYHGTDAQGRRIVTCYAHNSSLLVSVGQTVTKGEVIAKSGSTGRSTGPHCHFEVIIDDTKVNPLNYLG